MSTKEKAIAAGSLHATIHSMKRRATWHNYNAEGSYMLTLVTRNRQRLFGTLTGDPSIRTFLPGCARVECSDLCNAIFFEEIKKISHYYPMAEVWKLCVMPDHLHIILRIVSPLPEGKTLGTVVKGFKNGCNRAYWRIYGIEGENRPVLFEEGYCDKILKDFSQLDYWKRYLDDNPRRLMLKTMNPAFFSVRHHLAINGRLCAAIGNRFLLDIPDKMEVVVHRRDSDDEYKDKMKVWMQCGENYGVLVGAFISPREREVKQKAIENGFFLIQLTNEGIGPYYKPRGMDFDACADGRMLILSPWPEAAPEKNGITRQECLQLNALATQMAQGQFELG